MRIKSKNSNLFFYKSKTDDLLDEIKSFIFNQNAKVKYIKKPKPKAKKLLYIKKILTFFFFMPIQSASLEQTEKPCLSKKYLSLNIISLPHHSSQLFLPLDCIRFQNLTDPLFDMQQSFLLLIYSTNKFHLF